MEVSVLVSGERSGKGGGARARPSKFLMGLELGSCYLGAARAGLSLRVSRPLATCLPEAAGGDRFCRVVCCSGNAAGASPAPLLKEGGLRRKL